MWLPDSRDNKGQEPPSRVPPGRDPAGCGPRPPCKAESSGSEFNLRRGRPNRFPVTSDENKSVPYETDLFSISYGRGRFRAGAPRQSAWLLGALPGKISLSRTRQKCFHLVRAWSPGSGCWVRGAYGEVAQTIAGEISLSRTEHACFHAGASTRLSSRTTEGRPGRAAEDDSGDGGSSVLLHSFGRFVAAGGA